LAVIVVRAILQAGTRVGRVEHRMRALQERLSRRKTGQVSMKRSRKVLQSLRSVVETMAPRNGCGWKSAAWLRDCMLHDCCIACLLGQQSFERLVASLISRQKERRYVSRQLFVRQAAICRIIPHEGGQEVAVHACIQDLLIPQ
jgi:hypothetical protein